MIAEFDNDSPIRPIYFILTIVKKLFREQMTHVAIIT